MITMQAMRLFWREEERKEESGIFRLSVVTSPLFLIKSGGGVHLAKCGPIRLIFTLCWKLCSSLIDFSTSLIQSQM